MEKKNKMNEITINDYKKNLRLISIESILSSIGCGFSLSIMNLFWNSIGMNQADIGFTQMVFTLSIICLDIPMGYVADRFNRKVLNIIGDFGVAFTFLYYAFAKNMLMAITAEVMLGLWMAMTNGVDQAFIRYNCDKIDEGGMLFKKTNARIFTYKYTLVLACMIIGGVIAEYSYAWTIGISFIPYMISGFISIAIKDYGDNLKAKHKNPIKDMIITYKEILKIENIKTYLSAYMLGKEVTHSQVWVFTPLMVAVGVPVKILSIGWVLEYSLRIVGAKIGEKMVHKKTSFNFALSIGMVMLWMSVILIKINIFTIWIFILNGLTVGYVSSTLQTPLQENANNEIQTSVMSLASTGARLIYIPIVYVINALGEIKLQYALLGVIVFFLPASILTYKNLRKIEEK